MAVTLIATFYWFIIDEEEKTKKNVRHLEEGDIIKARGWAGSEVVILSHAFEVKEFKKISL